MTTDTGKQSFKFLIIVGILPQDGQGIVRRVVGEHHRQGTLVEAQKRLDRASHIVCFVLFQILMQVLWFLQHLHQYGVVSNPGAQVIFKYLHDVDMVLDVVVAALIQKIIETLANVFFCLMRSHTEEYVNMQFWLMDILQITQV